MYFLHRKVIILVLIMYICLLDNLDPNVNINLASPTMHPQVQSKPNPKLKGLVSPSCSPK